MTKISGCLNPAYSILNNVMRVLSNLEYLVSVDDEVFLAESECCLLSIIRI